LLRTKTQEVLAQCAILALGPWLGRDLPGIASVLEVTRQAVDWFRPAKPEAVLPGRFPIFILERGPDDVVYGFPDFERRGVKAAPHNHGPKVDAEDWGPPATDTELLPVGKALAELVPGAAGPIVDRDICLYTNTLPADRRGEEFIIDRWAEFTLDRGLTMFGSSRASPPAAAIPDRQFNVGFLPRETEVAIPAVTSERSPRRLASAFSARRSTSQASTSSMAIHNSTRRPVTGRKGGSEDLLAMRVDEWTPSGEAYARKLREHYDILRRDRVVRRNVSRDEYPPTEKSTAERRRSNHKPSRLRFKMRK
jgi:hypothetical protein